MNASVAPDDLEIVNNVIRGIAYHLDIDVAGDLQSQLGLYQAASSLPGGVPDNGESTRRCRWRW